MSEEVEQHSQKHHGNVMIWAMLIPMVYVLSIGPVEALINRGGRHRQMIMTVCKTVYAPLVWLHGNTPLKQPLEWYVFFWSH